MTVLMQDDDQEGNQIYIVKSGEARVGGVAVFRPADRTVIYAAVPNTMQVLSEPHAASGEALQTIAFDRYPVLKPATVRVQRKKTQQVNRGPVLGGADQLNENSVVKINSIKLGGTTYYEPADFKLTAGQVDWSPSGAEPATGNLYTVEFEFISIEPVLNQTPTTFQIANPVNGTVHYVDYEFAMRRYDRLVMDDQGVYSVIKGVPATWQPVPPDVPDGQLLLATVYQSWMQETRRLVLDSWRMVPMQTIANYSNRMDDIELDLAELRLATDVNGRYSGLKKGYFADPMRDDSMRDQPVGSVADVRGFKSARARVMSTPAFPLTDCTRAAPMSLMAFCSASSAPSTSCASALVSISSRRSLSALSTARPSARRRSTSTSSGLPA